MKIVKIKLEGLKFKEEVIFTELNEIEACEICEILNQRNFETCYYYQVLPDEL